MTGAEPARARPLEVAVRVLLGAGCLALLAWLLRRGPLAAPISLFASVGSTNAFYSATHILAAMALAGAAAGLWAALSRRAALPALGPALLLTLPLAAQGLSSAHALYPHDARVDFATAAALALFCAALCAAVGRWGGALPALAALAAAGSWLAVAGLRQFAAGQPTPAAWTGPAFASAIPVRISASLHNPNALAAALLLSMAGAGGLAVGARSAVLRVLGLLALLPLAAALPLTFSRGAYLGLAVAVLAAAALLPPGRRLRGLVALLVVALAVLAVAYKVPGVLFRAHSISLQGGGDVSSRFFTWRDALAVWHLRQKFGVGPGGLEALFAAHQPAGGSGTYVLISVPSSADNDGLQWLAENGWIGAALLGAGLLCGLASIGRGLARSGPDARAAGAVVLACLLGLAVQGLFEVTAYLLPVEGLGALALAALLGLSGLAGPRGLGRMLGLGLLTAGLVVAGALWQGWAPERTFAQGWTLVGQGRAAAARPLLREAAALDPSSARNVAAAGDAAVQAAYAAAPADRPPLAAEALSDLGTALRLDPWDGDTWSALAALLRLGAAPPAAACASQAALRDFPYSPWYALYLAADLTALGQASAARADQAYAARTIPLLLDFYREQGDQGQTYYAQAQTDLQQALASWSAAPLPAAPALPLAAGVCAAALRAAGLPGAPYAALAGP